MSQNFNESARNIIPFNGFLRTFYMELIRKAHVLVDKNFYVLHILSITKIKSRLRARLTLPTTDLS